MKAFQSICIHRDNAILVIVDAQNEFAKPGGKWYTETVAQIAPAVISSIHGLAERVRNAGIPVIYIQSVRTHQEPQLTIWGREPILKIGTWASQIIDELQPHKQDFVVQKFKHDPFYKTELDQVLARLVPDPTRYYAVVTGGMVNVCLYHATMGFHLRDFWTVVLEDCVFYITEPDKARALEQFSGPGYPNVFLSRSDLIEVSPVPVTRPFPKPGT